MGAVLFVLLVTVLSGCSSTSGSDAGASTPRELTLAHTPWEESYAVSLMTEVVLEDNLGYSVELSEVSADDALGGVSTGDYDAFQGVWLPGMEAEVSRHGGLARLDRWYYGTTRAGLAVPDYMETRSMRGVEKSGAETALVLQPGATALDGVPPGLLEEYGLRARAYPSVEAMLSAARPLYRSGEPFVMLAYSPNRMDLEFDLTYVEGEDALAALNEPQTIETVARDGLRNEQPEAFAFLNEFTLNESQVSSLEQSIREADDPRQGAEEWVASRGQFVNLWLSRVKAATR